MEKIKIISLLNEVLKEGDEVTSIQIVDENTIEIDGEVYKVLTDKEADENFTIYQENLIDDLGLNSFSNWAQEYIVDNFLDKDWFDEVKRETYDSYIEDIRGESSSDEEKYTSRLEEEIAEANCSNEEEYLDYLCNDEDSIIWYKYNFGNEELKSIVKENNLINWEEVIDWYKEIDGRGCLAQYDGEELELENNLYAYRID